MAIYRANSERRLVLLVLVALVVGLVGGLLIGRATAPGLTDQLATVRAQAEPIASLARGPPFRVSEAARRRRRSRRGDGCAGQGADDVRCAGADPRDRRHGRDRHRDRGPRGAGGRGGREGARGRCHRTHRRVRGRLVGGARDGRTLVMRPNTPAATVGCDRGDRPARGTGVRDHGPAGRVARIIRKHRSGRLDRHRVGECVGLAFGLGRTERDGHGIERHDEPLPEHCPAPPRRHPHRLQRRRPSRRAPPAPTKPAVRLVRVRRRAWDATSRARTRRAAGRSRW